VTPEPSSHSSGLYYTPDGEISYAMEQPYYGVDIETTEIHTMDGLIQVIPTSFRAIPYDEGGELPPGPKGLPQVRIAKGEFILKPESFRDPRSNVAAAFKIAAEKLGEMDEAMRSLSGPVKFATGGLITGPRTPTPAPPPDDSEDDDFPAPPPVWGW